MPAESGYSTYQNQLYDGMDSKRLILMLYDGALKHLKLTKEALEVNNIEKRGDHLGRAIAIIAELNASLNPDMDDDGTKFLRGLYASILCELPKVAVDNDPTTLDLASSYLEKLREIWKTSVMGIEPAKPVVKEAKPDQAKPAKPVQVAASNRYAGQYAASGRRAFSV